MEDHMDIAPTVASQNMLGLAEVPVGLPASAYILLQYTLFQLS